MEQQVDDEIKTVNLDPNAGIRVIALIATAVAILLVLSFLLTGGGGELFHRSIVVRTYFSDGSGLLRKATVQLNGIRVGKVRSVQVSGLMDPKRIVMVEMAIKSNYIHAIPEDSLTAITADNLLGDKYVNIKTGVSTTQVQPGAELSAQVQTTTFDPGDLIASLQSMLKSVNQSLDLIESPDTPIGSLFQTDDLYQKLRGEILNVQTAIRSYANPKNDIGKSLFRQELYEQLRKPVLEMDKSLAEIEKGPWLASTKNYDDIQAGIAAFHQSVQSIHAQPMLKDDELHDKVQAMLSNLSRVIDQFNSGQGAAGQLWTSAQLYESLNGSAAGTRKFLNELRKNPQKFLRVDVF